MVLLNLLLYRNSFCGIFRQASVLQASCRSASFQGMEVEKGSNKKRQIAGRAVTRDAVSSWQRGHFGYLTAPAGIPRMWFCPCMPAFPFICPGNQTRGSAAAFPVLFLVLLEGWDGAELRGSGPACIHPCRSCWESSVHALKHSEAGAWWAGQVQAQRPSVLSPCSPKGIRRGCGHSTGKDRRSVAVSKPKDNVKALLLWENLLQFLSSAFQTLAGELPGWWDTIPTDNKGK